MKACCLSLINHIGKLVSSLALITVLRLENIWSNLPPKAPNTTILCKKIQTPIILPYIKRSRVWHFAPRHPTYWIDLTCKSLRKTTHWACLWWHVSKQYGFQYYLQKYYIQRQIIVKVKNKQKHDLLFFKTNVSKYIKFFKNTCR